MTKSIVVFGANGCGKTTLARALAERLCIPHFDVEDYYFEEAELPYSKPRTKEAVAALLLSDMKRADAFVLSGVTCAFGAEIASMYRLGVFLTVPDTVRFRRVEQRSAEKFGARVLPGGDMYEQESAFFEFVKTRALEPIAAWAETLPCPVLRLDGTRPIAENARTITERFHALP